MKITDNFSKKDGENFSSFIEELFYLYFNELCFHSYSYVSDIETAKDIVQEAFLTLWTNRDSYTPTRAILYTIVKNKSIDYLRKNKAIKCFPNSQIQQETLSNYVDELIINQEDYLMFTDLSKEIQISVERLPKQCKIIFEMSMFQQMKNKEIAEDLNISIKAVEKQITKALYTIHAHLMKAGLF